MKTLYLLILLFITACNAGDNQSEESLNSGIAKANITKVAIEGAEFNYTFSVTVQSDETGCGQYADWWEVLKQDGTLVYRRILAHSHPNDQPFTRSGGLVKANQNELLYVRAHMNKFGYVGDVYKGSVAEGFVKDENVPTFPSDLDAQNPLPDGCAF
jgi:hypothetical protein